MIKIAVIGFGHWGPNHVRNFGSLSGVEVAAICDPSEAARKRAKGKFSGPLFANYKDMLKKVAVDAAVVSTPTATHFKVVKDCLTAGLDVLCEKPLTVKTAESLKLVDLAKSKKRMLMVGHVFVYNPGIMKLKELVDFGDLGTLYYLNAVRTNLGPIRHDVNALYDLASHDVSIFNYLLGSRPTKASATGHCYLQKNKGIEDLTFCTLWYPKNVVGHIHVSWLDPKKSREITVVGASKMVTWNDMENPRPLTVFHKNVERQPYYDSFGDYQLLVKEGDIHMPQVKIFEPLAYQSEQFVKAVKTRKKPFTDGKNGAEVVAVLQALQQSLKKQGATVNIKYT